MKPETDPTDTIELLRSLEAPFTGYEPPLPTVRRPAWAVIAGLVGLPILGTAAVLAIALLERKQFFVVLVVTTFVVVAAILATRAWSSRAVHRPASIGHLTVVYTDPSQVVYQWHGPDEHLAAAVLAFAHYSLRRLVVSESPALGRRAMALASVIRSIAQNPPDSPPNSCGPGTGPRDITVALFPAGRSGRLSYVATAPIESLIGPPSEWQAAAVIQVLATVAAQGQLKGMHEAISMMMDAVLKETDPDQEAFGNLTVDLTSR